jgi:superfamily II DNA/RNA helicase
LKVSKLFAKHLKISEQMESLSKSHFAIGVGTPNRLSKLISLGALRLNEVKIIIVDVEADEKNFTILTMPNVKDDFYEFMNSFKTISSLPSTLKITMIN